MKIHYVTGNPGKFQEAATVLQGLELIHTPLNLEEIQGNSQEIAAHKIKEAYSVLKEPCLIDDISVNCKAIGGLPGPYVRSFLEAIGHEGLAELILKYNDHSCVVVCSIAFMGHDGKAHIFEGKIEGSIVRPRGDRMAHTHSWNSIVLPAGYNETFAEMPLEVASKLSARSKALIQFKNYLLSS